MSPHSITRRPYWNQLAVLQYVRNLRYCHIRVNLQSTYDAAAYFRRSEAMSDLHKVFLCWVRERVERGHGVSSRSAACFSCAGGVATGVQQECVGLSGPESGAGADVTSPRQRMARMQCACVSDVNEPLSPYFRRCWCAKKQSAIRRLLLIHAIRHARPRAKRYGIVF